MLAFDAHSLFYFINQHYSNGADIAMQIASKFGEAWLIILLGLLLLTVKNFRNIWYVSGAVLCTVLPAIITQIIKFQILAPRPMAAYSSNAWVHILPTWDILYNHSFPSGHTTGAFSFFCFLACTMPIKYKFWGILFFILALSTAYARVYLAAHFFKDVYFGSIIGTVVAFVVFHSINYFRTKKEQA